MSNQGEVIVFDGSHVDGFRGDKRCGAVRMLDYHESDRMLSLTVNSYGEGVPTRRKQESLKIPEGINRYGELLEYVREHEPLWAYSIEKYMADKKRIEKDFVFLNDWSTYDVDLVFCIDTSESMEAHIDRVKKLIPKWCDRYTRFYNMCGRRIRSVRARIITFCDYRLNSDKAVLLTDFFDLKCEKEEFLKTLESVEIQPGHVESVCGLEALSYAFCSDWSDKDRRRGNIILFSNSEPNGLADLDVSVFHPKGIPSSIQELQKRWDNLGFRYVISLMTPDKGYWEFIARNFVNILHLPSSAGEEMTELEFEKIVTIAFSDV